MDEDRINSILSSFSCALDPDIESFLHKRAVLFEGLNKSRTFLIFNEEDLSSGRQLTVYGYFSLALKVLSVPDHMSHGMRKKLDGLSARLHGEIITDFPCYLIGQLARNTDVHKADLSGSLLISYALDVIADAVEAVGGRFVMIECHDDKHLLKFYSDQDFKEIARNPDNGKPMVQMIRRIC